MDIPTFTIEDKTLPIMLCGSAPFLGLGYFGFKAFEYRVRFYNHPDNMADIFIHFVRQGSKGVHVLCYDNILRAVKMAYDIERFPLVVSLNAENITAQLKKISKYETVLAFVHSSQTDSLNEELLRSITEEIRNAGMIPGLTTSAPGTSIPVLDEMDIDVSAYCVPINVKGKYMTPSKELTLKAVNNTKKKIIAEKPLAAGTISPEEGLPFVVERCDGFSLGFTDKDQIDAVYKILRQAKK